ncbi:anaerobic ribonucleoside-triphosphate reductase activating protein [Lachnospiraceae bacterium DSM 108991]|uniref:Anaerobic ribonucleoside-triphosphate reductase activating protein n=1 Tax=Claveliimonas monacensis TaxID=2779351 RepID=A0ABR9RHR5_9FIRM|nr:anaerobic ribonucleoside-triphosphate reductase activating protein [Claveliimonas monacensis]MBE5062509.1 anaerobic ribonucleoside-triphosphate reductase activating protein [Claveliimonas monacensis]
MVICGIQKLTLLDYPGKVACTIFTGGCNFRCPFCHNADLVTGKPEVTVTGEEIFRFLRKRQGLLDGVCISGGEPLLQPDLEDFIRGVRSLGYSVKLDTNGSMPDKLESLAEKGLLDYVAMDLKNAPEHYGRTIGAETYDVGNVDRSIRFLMGGEIPYEFRTTVVREFHQKADFEEMGRWIEGADQYFLQQFMDSGHVIAPGLHAYDEKILFQALEIVKKYVKTAQIRGL